MKICIETGDFDAFANASSASVVPSEVLEIYRTGIIPTKVFNRLFMGAGDTHEVSECSRSSEPNPFVGANIREAIRIVRNFRQAR